MVVILTLYGMWRYRPELFDNITFDERLEKNLLITYIMEYCGSNEVRYPEPEILKMCVDAFFKSKKDNYSRMLDALLAEYSPIENYDRTEERTIDINRENTVNRSGEDGGSDNRTLSSNTTDTIQSGKKSTTENKTSAFNATTYQPLDTSTTEDNGNSTDTLENRGTDNLVRKNNFSNSESGNGKEGHKEKARTHGNIGVTTNQQMINEEIELRKINIYELIALDFENEITIPVY